MDCLSSTPTNCPDVLFKVDVFDSASMRGKVLIPSGTRGEMGLGTGALKIGNEHWVSAFLADRIARFKADLMSGHVFSVRLWTQTRTPSTP